MPLTFRGVAHGPGRADRNHHADLCAGELLGVASGSLNGLPLHIEHDTSSTSVGSVLTSYMGSRGELRVMGQISDADTARRVSSGELRGLSLGTDCVQDIEGNTLSRKQKELSICEEGRRTGTWITHLGDKQVHEVACFSSRFPAGTSVTSRTNSEQSALASTEKITQTVPPIVKNFRWLRFPLLSRKL